MSLEHEQDCRVCTDAKEGGPFHDDLFLAKPLCLHAPLLVSGLYYRWGPRLGVRSHRLQQPGAAAIGVIEVMRRDAGIGALEYQLKSDDVGVYAVSTKHESQRPKTALALATDSGSVNARSNAELAHPLVSFVFQPLLNCPTYRQQRIRTDP